MSEKQQTPAYDGSQIQVLEGLEAVSYTHLQSAIRPPLGALAGSARSRVALWYQSQHDCVRRGSVANKT